MDEFQKIIDEALSKADDVVCDLDTYKAGLSGWIDEIRMKIDAAGGD